MKWKTLMFYGVCALALAAETGAELYQKALVKERGAGNLEEAIQLYQRVAREFSSDRALAARSLVQAGRCYEKLGQDKAVKLYEQVTREFGDQRDSAAIARERLAAMAGAGKMKGRTGMVARQIPITTAVGDVQSDGRRVFYVDYAQGLMSAGMDGEGARVIYPTTEHVVHGFSVSADGKQIVLNFIDRGAKKYVLCVMGSDGASHLRVRGAAKVMAHLMFGVLALTVDQWMRMGKTD